MTSWLLLNIKALLPFVLLSGAGTLLLLPAAFASHKKEDEERPLNKLILPSLIVLLVAAVIAWRAWLSSATIASGMVLSDRIAYGFDLLFIVVAFLTLLLSSRKAAHRWRWTR
jgi:NADH:ubiquinone oxidoreductase subunit 2 (subunit N)